MLKGLSNLKPPSPDDNKTITAVKNSIEDGKIPFKKNSKEEKEFFEALKRSGGKKEDIEDVTKTIEALRKAEAEKKVAKDEKPKDKEVKGVGGKTLVDPQGNPLTNEDMKKDKEEFDYKAPKDKDKDDIKIDPDTKLYLLPKCPLLTEIAEVIFESSTILKYG